MTEISRLELPELSRGVLAVSLGIIAGIEGPSVLVINSEGNQDTITTKYHAEKTSYCAGVLGVFNTLSIASFDREYEGFAVESFLPGSPSLDQRLVRNRVRLTRAINFINDFADLGIKRKATRATIFVPTKEFVVLRPVAN